MANSYRIRYIRLKQVFNRALDQSISKLQSWDKVSSCFPQYVNSKQGAMNVANCQRQLTEFWTELCQREFKEIMEERNVEQKLNELDELIVEAKERYTGRDQEDGNKEPAIEELSSKELVECHIYSQRIHAIQEIDERLAKVNEINDQLAHELEDLEAQVDAERKEINEMYDKYLGTHTDQPVNGLLVQSLNDMVLELKENY
ncbi:nnf1p [Saccharomyces arboricola H-6]|uniref:Kinetochore-associated protein n=1 Tax=Saccharomyces arboricola (strain H-6 / AS 2.3317 / CBS 10644) TaxID=1160507 RepID=J8Q678_SACAR|nr:nnf1p [Saccharomyces arboricola H-6]